MPTFLSLPREIRDEIYTYLLVSPSGLIAPYSLPRPNTLTSLRRNNKPPKSRTKKQQLHLITNPLSLEPWDAIYDTPDTFLADRKGEYLSLSIRSTCRQIYNETAGLFWSRNAFYFDGLTERGRGLGLPRTLKGMGQTASRLIERVTIRMTIIPANSGLRKALNTLSSRARLGNFQRLELVWRKVEMRSLIGAMYGESVSLFEELLEDLRKGLEGERFERVVRVPAFKDTRKQNSMEYDEAVRALHSAVGGTMICGDVVMWRDRVMSGS